MHLPSYHVDLPTSGVALPLLRWTNRLETQTSARRAHMETAVTP